LNAAARQRVELYRAALDEHGLERLYAQAVERRRAVEQHGVVLDDLFQHAPDRLVCAVHDALRALYVVRLALLDQLLHDERTEQLESHFLGQTALIHLELGATTMTERPE